MHVWEMQRRMARIRDECPKWLVERVTTTVWEGGGSGFIGGTDREARGHLKLAVSAVRFCGTKYRSTR